jgi:hypothetical protein
MKMDSWLESLRNKVVRQAEHDRTLHADVWEQGSESRCHIRCLEGPFLQWTEGL